MRGQFLLFDTDYTAVMLRSTIKDGKVTIGKGDDAKEFVVDKTRPFQLKTPLGTRPLYLLKWNSIAPMNFKVDEKTESYLRTDPDGKEHKIDVVTKDLVPVDPKFDETGKITPEMLKTTAEGRFLKGMKKYVGGGGGGGLLGGLGGGEGGSMLPLILGFFGGAIFLYFLIVMKLVPIK
jgi:hypothetical protein